MLVTSLVFDDLGSHKLLVLYLVECWNLSIFLLIGWKLKLFQRSKIEVRVQFLSHQRVHIHLACHLDFLAEVVVVRFLHCRSYSSPPFHIVVFRRQSCGQHTHKAGNCPLSSRELSICYVST